MSQSPSQSSEGFRIDPHRIIQAQSQKIGELQTQIFLNEAVIEDLQQQLAEAHKQIEESENADS